MIVFNGMDFDHLISLNQFVNYEYLHKSFLNREYTAKCKIDENSHLSMENKRRTNFFAKVICGAKIILNYLSSYQQDLEDYFLFDY